MSSSSQAILTDNAFTCLRPDRRQCLDTATSLGAQGEMVLRAEQLADLFDAPSRLASLEVRLHVALLFKLPDGIDRLNLVWIARVYSHHFPV